MVSVFIKSCNASLNCPCVSCKGKKEQYQLNKFKVQNTQMAVPYVLRQLSKTQWKTAKEITEEINITYTIVTKAINWLVSNEPNLLVDKQYLGKDGRLVKVYSLK